MPKKPKRPRDVISNAVHVMRIATGEIEESKDNAAESPAAELGRRGGLKGGRARANALPADRRSEIAKAAAKSRWRK